jgi:CHASE3 domain sensor protein
MKKVLLAFLAVSLVVVAVTAGLSFQQIANIRASTEEFRLSAQLSNYTSSLLESQLNGETGTRGFQITEAEDYLSPYYSSLRTTPLYLGLLREEFGNDPRIDNLTSLITDLTRKWNITILDRRNPVNGFELSRDDLINLNSKSNMDQIRSIVRSIQTEKTEIVKRRYSDAKSALTFLTVVMIIAMSLIALTVLVGSLIGLDMDSKGLRSHNQQLTLLLMKAEEATKLKSVFLANSQHTHTFTASHETCELSLHHGWGTSAPPCSCSCFPLFLLFFLLFFHFLFSLCSAVSHEIRTPMNGVRQPSICTRLGTCCLSRRCAQTNSFSFFVFLFPPPPQVLAMTRYLCSMDELSDEQQEVLDTVLTSAESMMRLIDDLLLFSKIEAQQFRLCPTNFLLSGLIKPLNDMFSIRCAGKTSMLSAAELEALGGVPPEPVKWIMHIDENLPQRIYADQDRLRQILTNLLDNAVKVRDNSRVSEPPQAFCHEGAAASSP